MNINTRILAFMAALLMPLQAWSAGVITVEDSIAGLGAEAQVQGLPPKISADVVIIPPSREFLVFPVTPDAGGSARLRIPGESLREAGAYGAFVGSQGKQLSSTVSFEVLPDTLDPAASTLSASPARIAAGGKEQATVAVSLRDRFRNPLAGRPVELIGSSTAVRVRPLQEETGRDGVALFAVSAVTPGSYTLRALDVLSDRLVDGEAAVTATAGAVGGATPYRAQIINEAYAAPEPFGVAERFEVSLGVPSPTMDEMVDLTIRALDANGNTVMDYAGRVLLSSPTDPSAVLPGFSDISGMGEVRFEGRHRGVRNIPLSVSFRRAGRQTLRAEDAAGPGLISGETTVTVIARGAAGRQLLRITAPRQNATVGGTTVLLEGATQPFTNISVSGGAESATGESDAQGVFQIPVLLDANLGEYTLHITDDVGGDVSLHLVRDTDPPVITNATFSPAEPQEGASTLLVVQSEPGLPLAAMELGAEKFVLQEDAGKPGTYQLLFTAPKAGTYKPSITARDTAGNVTNYLVDFAVLPKMLPPVTNLRAAPRTGSVELSWDPVTGDSVGHYRIYVGERGGEEYQYSLDTPDASRSAATVTELQSGVEYLFAVTAVRGERESQKGTPVRARVLGLMLAVTPQPESLFLEWSFPSAVSVQSFLVEYGTEPGALTEKRMLPGGDLKADERRSVTLRDLLPGITYHLRLTPLAVTGEALRDLIATGQGAPLANDGLVFDPAGDPPPFLRSAAPPPPIQAPQTGLPLLGWWLLGALALTVPVAWHWRYKRKMRAAMAFLRALEARYRS